MNEAPSQRRLAVLISGRGSNLQALIDAIGDGRLRASIAVVISNDPAAGGLDRARKAGIETVVVSHRGWPERERDRSRVIVATIEEADPTPGRRGCPD